AVALPDARELLLRHSGTGVRHGEPCRVAGAFDRHGDGPSAGGERGGVVEQVRQDLMDASSIAAERALLARVALEQKPLLRRQGSEDLEALLQQAAHPVDRGLDGELTGLEAAEVEQVADQALDLLDR